MEGRERCEILVGWGTPSVHTFCSRNQEVIIKIVVGSYIIQSSNVKEKMMKKPSLSDVLDWLSVFLKEWIFLNYLHFDNCDIYYQFYLKYILNW